MEDVSKSEEHIYYYLMFLFFALLLTVSNVERITRKIKDRLKGMKQ